MLKFGLLGKNIQKSRSKEMYEKILGTEVDYCLFDFANENDIPQLSDLLSKLQGLSITAPYKKHFLSDVKIKGGLESLEAINCIRKSEDGFEATNTDYLACEEILS